MAFPAGNPNLLSLSSIKQSSTNFVNLWPLNTITDVGFNATLSPKYKLLSLPTINMSESTCEVAAGAYKILNDILGPGIILGDQDYNGLYKWYLTCLHIFRLRMSAVFNYMCGICACKIPWPYKCRSLPGLSHRLCNRIHRFCPV